MATVYVNDKPVDIGSARLNCIQAAEKAGVLIPHYCWHEALTVVASCRMCLVEMGDLKDGKVAMQPKVVPGCQTLVKDGAVIVTGDYGKRAAASQPLAYPDGYKPGVKASGAQADTLEGLLLNHPLDCPVCDKAGECKLQDYSFEFGNAQSRMIDEKLTPANKPELSSKITLFTDRCIMCSRCVRFTREISGTAELQILNRGDHAEIDVFPGHPLENKLAGNVVDLCPVGALGSKDFLYKQRVWYLQEAESVCAGCSTGCSIAVDRNKDVVFRLRPRENPQAQGHFICDEGRYGYHYVNSTERIRRPLVRRDDGKLYPVNWAAIIPAIRQAFQDAASRGDVYGILSPFLSVEEAFLAAKWFNSIGSNARLILGPVPVIGSDDTYPKDRRGNAVQPVKFTIHSEKCPNRLGVETILKHFQGEITPFESIAHTSNAKGVFFVGGYPDPKWSQTLESPLLIVADLFLGQATRQARFVLPASTFAEKDGIYINHAGLAQKLARCVKSPGEVRSEGQIFMALANRPGLFNAGAVRQELATAIPIFASLAGEIGEEGIRLLL